MKFIKLKNPPKHSFNIPLPTPLVTDRRLMCLEESDIYS